MSELTYQRGIADVTRDIRIKTGQFLMDAIEIGRLLYEAKSMVEPGSWGKYVEEELPFSHSWANNYMRLYKELGGEQLTLFGNSQALMNLSPTKALEMLVLAPEEREEFLESHDVEAMSSRELHQAIKDLEEEKKAREQAEREIAGLKEDLQDAKEAKKAVAEDARETEKKLLKVAADRDRIADDLEGMQKKLQEAVKKEKEAAQALQRLRENPEIPETMMESLRKEAEAEAAAKARETLQKQTEGLEEQLRAAKEAAAAAEERLASIQKEAKLGNPNVVIFKTIMGQIQDDFNRMNGVLMKAQQEDPAVADNLKKAFLGLLDKLREAI